MIILVYFGKDGGSDQQIQITQLMNPPKIQAKNIGDQLASYLYRLPMNSSTSMSGGVLGKKQTIRLNDAQKSKPLTVYINPEWNAIKDCEQDLYYIKNMINHAKSSCMNVTIVS